MKKIDYTNCSATELQQVLEVIDKEKYPQNFNSALAELNKRLNSTQDNLCHHETDFKYRILAQQCVFWLSWLSIIAIVYFEQSGNKSVAIIFGVLGVLGLVSSIFFQCANCRNPSGFRIIFPFLIAAFPVGFCIHCGQRYIGFRIKPKG